MTPPIMEFDHVSKRFEVYSRKKTLFRLGRSLFAGNPIKRELWALKDITFEMYEGEKVALIGRNGAGKTTLLRMASHILRPTQGYIRSRKPVRPVLSYALGLNPHLSVIDNIYIMGAYYGLLVKELTPKIPEILKYCGLEEFAFVQVKDLSGGQRQRIGFSVFLYNQDPFLAFDESASVADLQFQSKAVASFSRIIQSDRTILLATHSLTFVAKYCSRVLWLEKGELKMTGTPAEVIPAYTQFCLPDGEAAKTLPAASESSIPPEERLP